MTALRDYIKSQLIEPLKLYPTTVQDTLLTIISDRLEELYDYTKRFPSIISPDTNRLDILQAILKQFQFHIRDEANLYEQIAILENILYVYRRRGSVETIENMWKYYGGDLPREVKLNIPSANLFRYSVSRFSASNVYQDGELNRQGTYEVILYDSNYDTVKLKDFMVRELIAAGNKLYFKNKLYSIIDSSQESAYKYLPQTLTHVKIYLSPVTHRKGLSFSESSHISGTRDKDIKNTAVSLGTYTGNSYSLWSGSSDLYFEMKHIMKLGYVTLNRYELFENEIVINRTTASLVRFLPSGDCYSPDGSWIHLKEYAKLRTSYTPSSESVSLQRYLYDKKGNLISTNPGYFVLNETYLGTKIL